MKVLVEQRAAPGQEGGGRRAPSAADVRRLARFLWAHVGPRWPLLAGTLGCAAVYSIASATRSYLAKGVIDVIRAPVVARDDVLGMWDEAKVLAAVATFLAVVLGASDYGKECFHQSLVLRVIISIRDALVRHVLSLPLRFFHRRRLGDLMSRMTNDVAQANQALMFLFGELAEDVLTIAACLANCVAASGFLTVVAFIAGPALLLPVALIGSRVRTKAHRRQGALADITESMQQMFSGVRTVKAFGAEVDEVARFRIRSDDLFASAISVVQARAFTRGLLEAVNNGLVPLIILCGIWMVRQEWLSASELTWFVGALVLMYPRVRRVARSFHTLQDSLAGLERLEELLDEQPAPPDAPDARPLAGVRGDVSISGVSFAYDGVTVLHDLDIDVKAGEVIALVGPSGGGKSTLLDLLARLYDPDKGVIRVDGVDLRKITRASWAAHLGIVTQDAFLFNDTVLENVRYGRRTATREQVEAACRAARVHEVIAALPAGYETVIGERGVTLSGGERQRLAIARALVKDPRVLLLDEATSALDSRNERLVQEAIERLVQGRTTFVVAHRLSTVVRADRILVLDRGRVVEQGTHEDLVTLGGLYANLSEMQGHSPASTPDALQDVPRSDKYAAST